MPFVFIIIGAILLASSVQNTQSDLYTLVKGDLTGPNNYLSWLFAILVIGAVGYIPTLKPLSRIFLVLVLAGLFLHGNDGQSLVGILQQFNAQILGSGSGVANVNLSGDGLTTQQWLDSLTANTPTGIPGIETPLASARPN